MPGHACCGDAVSSQGRINLVADFGRELSSPAGEKIGVRFRYFGYPLAKCRFENILHSAASDGLRRVCLEDP